MTGQQVRGFKCPFETKGLSDDTILDIQLTGDRSERLRAMVAAFLQFHSRPECVSIKFVLPPSVKALCSDNRTLKPVLLPYQCELLAAQLDYRLRPLIKYFETAPWVEARVKQVVQSDHKRTRAAMALMARLKDLRIPWPANMEQQATWIEVLFQSAIDLGMNNPTETMSLRMQGQLVNLIRMEPASLTLFDDREKLDDPSVNRNSFSIVKTPYYPKDFGRYSEQIEIWITREADVAAQSPETRARIRTMANEVHRAHGIPVTDVAKDVQPLGLWIPEVA